MTLSLDGPKTQSLTPQCPFPNCSEKERRDVFLRKTSNQNVFHTSMGRDVCVSVYLSVHNIFVSLNVLFNQLDRILWL